MGKLKKPIIASLVILIIFSVIAALLRHSRGHGPGHVTSAKSTSSATVVLPPANKLGAKVVSSIPNQKTADQKALSCLNAICDSGASEAAVTEMRGLLERLAVTTQPFAKRLSSVLKSILSAMNEDGSDQHTILIPQYPGISHDIIDRAFAACYARGHRRSDEIVLSFAGDCTFGTVNSDDSAMRFPSVYRRSGQADYPFALIRPWFLNDDLTVVNFECTLTNAAKTADKQWHFKGPARYASIFPAGSVEAVGLSNNHSHDYLQSGFNDTVANFKKAHVPAFYQNTPYITTLKGVETVIIGDCTVVGENTTLIDGAPQRVIAEIKRYKKPDNIVIVAMHWGSELDTIPRPWQQVLGRKFIDAGADAVVGHHPHVVQGIERYKGKYIAYSLGNFAFGGNSLAHNPDTFILRLRFHQGGGQTSVLAASIVPCWISSSQARNGMGVLKNNYQPKPLFGKTADQTAALLLARSARLMYGLKRIEYLHLQQGN